MLQQTTTTVVMRYFPKFLKRWPMIHDLAQASEDDVLSEWAGLGYYSRARNLHKCARIITSDFNGTFPADPVTLQRLPGIGEYTASAIAAIAFNHKSAVVDGNVVRVVARLFAIDTALPAAKRKIRRRVSALVPATRPGDFAQALMDLGATICRPGNPDCGICPCAMECLANRSGNQSTYPVRRNRVSQPVRKGILFIGRRIDGAWLLERRSRGGLLGGMLGWPGSEWDTGTVALPPCKGEWIEPDVKIFHAFTHFKVIIRVHVALLALDCTPGRGSFVPVHDFDPNALPVLMRKAFAVAMKHDALILPPTLHSPCHDI